MGGDGWISVAAIQAAFDGYTPNVYSILFSNADCVLGSQAMGMEDGSFG